MHNAVTVDVVRTPRGKGKPGGALSGIHPQELLAGVLRELAKRTGLDPGLLTMCTGGGMGTATVIERI